MPSFRMLPTRHYYEVQDRTTISALPRCSNLSFLRLLRHSRNFWHITTLKQGSQSKQSIIGITLGTKLSSVPPMSKRLPISVKGLRCSRHYPRHQREHDAK